MEYSTQPFVQEAKQKDKQKDKQKLRQEYQQKFQQHAQNTLATTKNDELNDLGVERSKNIEVDEGSKLAESVVKKLTTYSEGDQAKIEKCLENTATASDTTTTASDTTTTTSP